MSATSQTERELSPYLKAMVGEGVMRPDVARIFARLDSQERQRLAFRELQQMQVSAAEAAVSKITFTNRKDSPELGRRIWMILHGFRKAGECLAIPFAVPAILLVAILSHWPRLEKVFLSFYRLLKYLSEPLWRGEPLQEPEDIAFSQKLFCTLFVICYLTALVWIPWRVAVWMRHLIY